MVKLNPRQEKFCVAYARSGNATEAYREAGYKAKTDETAWASASEILRKPKVKERLEEIRKETSTPKILDAQQIQEMLTIGASRALEKGNESAMCKCIEILNKMHGRYIQRIDMSTSTPIVIKDDVGAADD